MRGFILILLATAGGFVQASEDARIETVATNLDVPWEIAFLPDGDLLVTERPGHLVRLPAPDQGTPVNADDGRRWPIRDVKSRGEAGLMGLALHPAFEDNHWIYLMLTAADENRVERYRLTDDGPAERTVILDGIPAGVFHDGGRIAFGPDGYLWITTGDATDDDRAQDRGSPAGKILRVTDTGAVPEGNPFDSPVWSWGHRNPQGLARDDEGRLWSTEHGPSGWSSGEDEINRIEKGANYGWPSITGDETEAGMRTPEFHSGDDTWAPAGLAAWKDRLFFGGLRGSALYVARVRDGKITGLTARFRGEFGRIRAVTIGPDGLLYFATSNRDGRGRVREGDDRILRIAPESLATAAE